MNPPNWKSPELYLIRFKQPHQYFLRGGGGEGDELVPNVGCLLSTVSTPLTDENGGDMNAFAGGLSGDALKEGGASLSSSSSSLTGLCAVSLARYKLRLFYILLRLISPSAFLKEFAKFLRNASTLLVVSSLLHEVSFLNLIPMLLKASINSRSFMKQSSNL